MLVSQFGEIRMEEEEIFDDFYFKLSTIRNSTINLGKKMVDAKIVKKILDHYLQGLYLRLLLYNKAKI
jgi:hypothetical protein